jgi:hypothetical protein
MPIRLEGPAFQVEGLAFDAEKHETRVRLDDGSEEVLVDAMITMNPETGRFECAVKSGRARAVLAQAAQDALLDRLEEDGGDFFVPVGAQRCRVMP